MFSERAWPDVLTDQTYHHRALQEASKDHFNFTNPIMQHWERFHAQPTDSFSLGLMFTQTAYKHSTIWLQRAMGMWNTFGTKSTFEIFCTGGPSQNLH